MQIASLSLRERKFLNYFKATFKDLNYKFMKNILIRHCAFGALSLAPFFATTPNDLSAEYTEIEKDSYSCLTVMAFHVQCVIMETWV